MSIERSFFDPGLILLSVLGFASVTLLVLTVPRPFAVRSIGAPDRLVLAAALAIAGLVAFAATGEPAGAAAAAIAAAAVCAIVHLAAPKLSAAGVLQMSLGPLSAICLTPWAYLLLHEQQFPAWALHLVLVGGGLGVLLAAYSFATQLADEAVFTHVRWRRPTQALPEPRHAWAPKVSIHVPCYAEPPDVVIATLERLAALRYPNYEVIVCDNNTPDEALWRPVQSYCRMLNADRIGAAFRFFHVSPLEGAKAGALNFCLERTAPGAEIIAVVDADYLAEPDFLARLTGFFADEKVGFVQTPHDYRPDPSAYQAMCYWEYMPPNKVALAGINEYECAYTIGTMCLFRKDAIEAAGGWAEWCLTEDSEISVRVRALGYEGVYVNETFGRGLIPETYEDLKKQRFRWTAGPVQQLLVHWRLLLPSFMGARGGLHGWVKLLEAHRCLSPLVATVGLVAGVAGMGVALWLTVADVLPPIRLPQVFWIAAALSAFSGLGKLWQQYRLTGCSAPHAIAGAEIARLSLALVKTTAALAALTGRPMKWRRTPKFAPRGSLLRCAQSTAPELAITAAFGLLLYFPLHYRSEIGDHAALIAAMGCVTGALAFLTAPVMAVLSEARIRASLTVRDEARDVAVTSVASEAAAAAEPCLSPVA